MPLVLLITDFCHRCITANRLNLPCIIIAMGQAKHTQMCFAKIVENYFME